MSREWTPGDVAAVATAGSGERVGVYIGGENRECWHLADADGYLLCIRGDAVEARPLVVIDPEDREQVVDLVARYCKDYGGRYEPEGKHRAATDSMQTALRSLLPPPCTVFEHYPSRTDEAGTITALCGKVWRRDRSRTVVGRCPECEAIVAAGWVS